MSKELDSIITQTCADQGISESTSVRVMNDAVVIVSVIRASTPERMEEIIEELDEAMPGLSDSDNIRISKVVMDQNLGSLNT